MGRFLQIAMGSANELEYHLLLARDLEVFESADDFKDFRDEVIEMQSMLDCSAASGGRGFKLES